MTKNLSESPENIIKRLEKLRLWQEEQQRIIVKRQHDQRQMLNLEQRKMYELLGISKECSSLKENSSGNKSGRDSYLQLEEGISILDENDKSEYASTIRGQNEQEAPENLPPKLEKRRFLKRGEGLTNRFKIDPDAFRLHNLPKYKYANVHRKFLQKRSSKAQIYKAQKEKKSETNKKQQASNARTAVVSQKKFGLRLQKSNSKSLNTAGSNTEPDLKLCRENEQDIQNDSRSYSFSHNSNRHETSDSSKNVENASNSFMKLKEQSPSLRSVESALKSTELETTDPITWAQVLDPKNPIPIECFRNISSSSASKSGEELDNLSIFELLEKKAEEGSFSLNFSSIRRWVATKANLDLNSVEVNESMSTDQVKSGISPVPFDIDKNIVLDESDEDSSENDECPKSEKGHVRFDDNIQVNEVESDAETVLSNEIEYMNISKTSTPNEKNLFEKFKAELFADDSTQINDSTLIADRNLFEDKKQEILAKSELLKTRLAELENEISVFKQHNAELTKLKQEHELEKIQVQQERIEMEEKLNDERIKIEIYLHDERMKLEEEKKKVEKMLKEQKLPNRKEREEIAKLKEQVESLQKENKNKESRHVAAQSRLRAQIRILEKEVKDLNFENEHLKKEIKKLESENARLNRMNNNKMLQEINKTIAKLAPKAVSTFWHY